MKLSKNNLNELTTLYLNDLSDYGKEGESDEAEDVIDSLNVLNETEENLYEIIKKTTNTSPRHKQIINEFLSFLTELPDRKHEIKNIKYYQQLLDMNRYSYSQREYLQGIINSVKRQNSLATDRQFNILQRLKTGDFNYGKK